MSIADSRPPRPLIWAPLFVLTVVSVISWLTPLDMWIQQAFYGGEGTWPYAEDKPWRMLYEVGPLLGVCIGAGSFFGFIGSYCWRKLRPWRQPMIFLALAAFVGPALVVNFIFKDHYGRPRPREVVEFGGERQYLDVWVPGEEKGHSFPSGHSSIAFYLMTPYFVLLAWRRRMAYGFLVVGFGFGLLMGMGRMVQGAHFLTDVLWSAGMVYLVDYALYYLLRLNRWTPPRREPVHSTELRPVLARPVVAGSASLSRERDGVRP